MAVSSPLADPAQLADVPLTPMVPPLENGDRLTRDEFERRYNAMPSLKKAELIEHVVYVPSPVRHPFDGRQHSQLVAWLCPLRGKYPRV